MNKHMSGRGRRNDIHSSDVHNSDVQNDAHNGETQDMQHDLVERMTRNTKQTGTDDITGDKTIEDNKLEIKDVLAKDIVEDNAQDKTEDNSQDNNQDDSQDEKSSAGGDSEASAIQDVINEDTIEEYLISHPDLFRRRPDILSKLNIPHIEADGASSLVEKQVNRLRLELTNKQSRFEQVVESARMAEQQQARVHRTTLSLVSAATESQVKERVLASLKVDFNIDCVAIRLESDVEQDNIDAYTMLRDRVAQGRSFCDHRLPRRSMDWLFADETQNIASCAVVPVSCEKGDNNVLGIIGLGDADPERFSRDMGTVYLDRLGQLIGAVLARL